jgi:hypothetical protein
MEMRKMTALILALFEEINRESKKGWLQCG